jgi:signal peptidase I
MTFPPEFTGSPADPSNRPTPPEPSARPDAHGSGPESPREDEGLEADPKTVIAVGERAQGYDGSPPADAPLHRSRHRKTPGFWRELPILIGVAVILALLIKTFLVQAFYIPSGSMEQTLHINDRVLVNKIVYHLRDPHRGEIVVFDTKGTGFEGQGSDFAACGNANAVVKTARSVQRFLGMGSCGDNDFIKRVIAVPGDTVQCCTPQNQVLVNGEPLTEKYLYQDNHEAFCAAPPSSLRPAALGPDCRADAKPITVPKGQYWVMGDHRGDSDDSRPNGFVPGDKIVGRAFVKVWPPSRIGFLHVPNTVTQAAVIGFGIAAAPVLSAPMLLVPLLGCRAWLRRRGAGRRTGRRRKFALHRS